MKTGIITFHQALNYGAVLQTYALQKTIQNMGSDCEVIDYACKKINDDYKTIDLSKCKSKKDYLRTIPFFFRMNGRRKSFNRFLQEYLVLSNLYTDENIKDIDNNYDSFITGSDQVFNDKCTDLDENYFLAFTHEGKKKNSYAASFGFQKVPEQLEDKYKELLKDFENLSVREEKGVEIVKDMVEKDAIQHVDPTLVLSFNDWKELVKERPCKEKYVFLYTVMDPVNAYQFAKKLADEKGFTLIYLHGTIQLREKIKKEDNVKHLYTISPDDFITYLYHADYVVTNSFHGTVFSSVFRKKFVVELETGWNYNHRSEELLKLLKLDNHILNELSFQTIEQESDWDYVTEYLGKEAERSKQYLKEVIVK